MYPFGIVVYFRFFDPQGKLAYSAHPEGHAVFYRNDRPYFEVQDKTGHNLGCYMQDAISCILPIVANAQEAQVRQESVQ